jgi:preprotein translocase subunit SecA
MGTRLNIQNNVNHDMLIASDRVLNIVTSRFFKFWLHPDVIYKRTKYFVQEQIYARYVQKFARDVLKANKQKNAARKVDNEQDDVKAPQIFISQLLKISRTSSDEFTDSEVVAETITTIMAVSDKRKGGF